MPHTTSRYMMDLDMQDARVHCALGDIVVSPLANTTLTRNAAGQWYYLLAASNTFYIACNLTNQALRRTGFFEDIQEQFGSTSGSGIPGSAQPQQYRPDQIGSMSTAQELQPRTALKVKGFKMKGFDLIYTVLGNNLTSIASRVDLVNFSNGVAWAATNIVPSAANNLSVVVSATVNVLNYTLTAAQLNLIEAIASAPNGYLINPDQELWVETQIVTPAGSTVVLYGYDFAVSYNFN